MAALQTRVGYTHGFVLENACAIPALPLLRRRSSADAERVSGQLSVTLKRRPQDAAGSDVTALVDLAAVSMEEVELWQPHQDLERVAQTDPFRFDIRSLTVPAASTLPANVLGWYRFPSRPRQTSQLAW